MNELDTQPLQHRHLFTLKLDVDSRNAAGIGATPSGQRSIAPITGGRFEGERLSGEVLPGGADWLNIRSDGTMEIDVRLVLKTHDDVKIYLTYQGRFKGDAKALPDLARGKVLEADRYSLVSVARLECGHPQYSWLNDVVAVGSGQQSGFNPIYSFYEIG